MTQIFQKKFSLWLLITGIWLFALFFSSVHSPFTGVDQFTYLAHIQNRLDDHDPIKGLVISPLRTGDHGGRFAFQLFDLLLIQLFGILGGNASFWYWEIFPILLAVLSLAIRFLLAKSITKSYFWAMLAIVTQIVWVVSSVQDYGNGVGYLLFFRLIEDKHVIRFLFWPISLWATWEWYCKGRKKNLVILIAVLIISTFTHPIFAPLYILSIGLFCFLNLFHYYKTKAPAYHRSMIILLVGLLLLSFPLYQRLTRNYGTFGDCQVIPDSVVVSNDIYRVSAEDGENDELLHRLILLNSSGNQYLINPFVVLNHPFFLLLIGVWLIAIKQIWSSDQGRWLSCILLTVILTCFIPGLASLMGKLITTVLHWRITWLVEVPVFLVFALQQFHYQYHNSPAYIRKLFYALAIISTVLLLHPLYFSGKKLLLQKESPHPKSTIEVMNYLHENGAQGKTILTPNTITDNYIPAIAGNFYGLTFRNQPPRFCEPTERRRKFYETTILTSDDLETLAYYEVQYILTPHGAAVASQMRYLPHLFQLLYENSEWQLFEWHPELLVNEDRLLFEHQKDLLAMRTNTISANSPVLKAMQEVIVARNWQKRREEIRALDNLVVLDDKAVWPYLRKASLLSQLQQSELAILLLQKIIRDYPDVKDEAQLRLARLYVKQKKMVQAETTYLTILEERPFFQQGLRELSELYLTIGRKDDALKLYRYVLNLETQFSWAEERIQEIEER